MREWWLPLFPTLAKVPDTGKEPHGHVLLFNTMSSFSLLINSNVGKQKPFALITISPCFFAFVKM